MNRINLNTSPVEGKCTEADLDILRGVMTDEALLALSQRNAARLSESRQALGSLYLLHPANAVTRKVPHVA